MTTNPSNPSASVLLAAYTNYLSSSRSLNEWSEFIDTFSQCVSSEQHGFPLQQATLSSGVELPRIGIPRGVTQSSVVQKTSERFEALLDELYLTQGLRSEHNAGVSGVMKGTSLTTASITPLRFLSATCFRSLKDLFLQSDPTLEALFSQYRDAGGVTSEGGRAYEDFLHSLIILSQRWKRYIFYSSSSPTTFLRQSQVLFDILNEFVQNKLITYGELDFVENVLYNVASATVQQQQGSQTGQDAASHEQQKETEFLLAAWSICWDGLETQSDSPSNLINEFYDSLLHLLESQICKIYKRYTDEAKEFLLQLKNQYHAGGGANFGEGSGSNTASPYSFSPATLKYLLYLLDFESSVIQTKRRNGLPLSKSEQVLQEQSTLLFACFAESASSQNVYELLDTLQYLGQKWRRSSKYLPLLQCLSYISENGLITRYEADIAEVLVYDENVFLIAAWQVYEESEYTSVGFDEFIDSVRIALRRYQQEVMHDLAREGYHLMNVWSENPDRVELFEDPMRHEVLGVRRIQSEKAEEMTTNPFSSIFPSSHLNTLNTKSSNYLRALLARRDPVLLAMLAVFHETQDMEELMDGCVRLVKLAGERKVGGGGEGLLTGGAGAGQSSSTVTDTTLDVYQLSQMLLSLHSDGYITRDTFLTLLYAVERYDSVMLAAFMWYKEQLDMATTGKQQQEAWADLWDTMQRVYQHLVRNRQGNVTGSMMNDEEQEQQHATSYLSPSTAVLLRHLGTRLLDSLSSSNHLTITDTLYLRDLLRTGDTTFYAILSLGHEGTISEEEVREDITLLGKRWMKVLDKESRRLIRLLISLEQSRFLTASGLDYLLGLVYSGDDTLAGAYSLYAEQAMIEDAGTESDEPDEEEDGEGEYDEDEDSEYDDEEDEEDDEEDDSEDDGDSEYDDDTTSDDDDEHHDHAHVTSGRPHHQHQNHHIGGRHHLRHSSSESARLAAHHRRSSPRNLPTSLTEFVDNLCHILASGERTIKNLVEAQEATQGMKVEEEWERQAEREVEDVKREPRHGNLGYYEQ